MTEPLVGPTPRGPRGFPGLYPAPAWFAQTWVKYTITAHLNCIWFANETTEQEPAFGPDGTVSSDDWDLWVDGRGAELTEDAAEAAAAAQAAVESIAPGAPGGV
ncbi:MAG: hypothetical protein QM651_18065, partial [Rhodoblastus sp.]